MCVQTLRDLPAYDLLVKCYGEGVTGGYLLQCAERPVQPSVNPAVFAEDRCGVRNVAADRGEQCVFGRHQVRREPDHGVEATNVVAFQRLEC
jgi:hypothetical protein